MPEPKAAPGEQPQSIVIVDDEPANLEALSLFFRKRGYAPHVFSDALTALKELRQGLVPALVISDFRMPGMDGLQFVERLRAEQITAPIIVLTAYGDLDAYFRFFSLGVFEYVHKPVRDGELERVVRAALLKDDPAARAS